MKSAFYFFPKNNSIYFSLYFSHSFIQFKNTFWAKNKKNETIKSVCAVHFAFAHLNLHTLRHTRRKKWLKKWFFQISFQNFFFPFIFHFLAKSFISPGMAQKNFSHLFLLLWRTDCRFKCANAKGAMLWNANTSFL